MDRRSPYSPGNHSLPLPSPSLSPSITSLLNAPESASNNAQDYFAQDAAPNDYFSNPSLTLSASSLPSAGGSPSAGAPRLANLLSPAPDQLPPRTSPSPSHSDDSRSAKRARTASSDRVDEEDQHSNAGSMPPPPRRDSSSQPPARPHSSSPRRASSSTPVIPPPPPPAPRPLHHALEPSIFNVEPIDEFTREVADWLWGFCQNLDWEVVEVRAFALKGA